MLWLVERFHQMTKLIAIGLPIWAKAAVIAPQDVHYAHLDACPTTSVLEEFRLRQRAPLDPDRVRRGSPRPNPRFHELCCQQWCLSCRASRFLDNPACRDAGFSAGPIGCVESSLAPALRRICARERRSTGHSFGRSRTLPGVSM